MSHGFARSRRVAYTTLALLFGACAAPSAAPTAESNSSAPRARCVTLLATNDVHGSIEGRVLRASGHSVETGGLLTMSGYVEAIRKTSPHPVFLLDAGDIYQGTLASNHFWGRSIIDIYNAMDFDLAVLGNHEFDFGDGERKNKDVLGVVRDRVAQAEFPFLTANVYEKSSGERIDWPNTRPSVLLEKSGIKVGFIGASTTSTPTTTKAQNVVSLSFPDPAPIIEREAAKLRAAGAELVVFVAHIGGGCKNLLNPFDLSTCDLKSEMFDILSRLPEGTIDVAAGGHTHQYVAHWYRGIATVEAGARAKSLARVDACVSPDGGIDEERSTIHQPIEMCAREWHEGGCKKRKNTSGTRPATYAGVAISPTLVANGAATPYLEKIATLKNQDLNVLLPFQLERDDAPREKNLGLLIAEGMARTTKSGLAIHNRGGVRADIEAGPVQYGEVFMVSPFGNLVAHVNLTPDEIHQFVEALYSRRSQIPYMNGLVGSDTNGTITVSLASGEPWDPKKRYTIATSDFVAYGGDGFQPILDRAGLENRFITDTLIRDALITMLKERFPNTGSATATREERSPPSDDAPTRVTAWLTSTRFLPPRLASYIAESARLMSCSGDSVPSNSATPMLTLTFSILRSPNGIGLAKATRILSATSAAMDSELQGSRITVNSSPPR
ncbi:MAG: bifunctional UDP-sugar hydrolase/5'-nucleotidase [Myxococcota bacterium]